MPLSRLRAQAEAAVQVSDQFLSIASHELRTPLTSVYATLLERILKRQTNDAQVQRTMERVIQQAQRLNGMIEDLLNVSGLQQGQFEVNLQLLELGAHVAHSVDTFRMTLPTQEQGRTIEVLCTAGPLEVLADEQRLEEVFQNLLSNAVKYSSPEQPVLVRVTHHAVEAVVEIVDQGVGIPSDAVAHLFMPFYRAPNLNSQTRGFGIELYVVHELVQHHGGRIEVDSTAGAGSTFRVALPLHASSNNAA